ncbi:chaplin family protein [Streptomyces sp. NPDC054794]
MKRVTRNGVIAVAAASGAMAMTIPAFADSGADGSAVGSPGVVSGNTVQLPVHVPVNVCGNTVNVVGLLNPAAGNACANKGGSGGGTASSGTASSGTASSGAASSGGATAHGGGMDSPGVLSGNGVQLPIHVPVNVSGNGVNVVGVGNPATGNSSVNTSGHPDQPASPVPPRSHPVPQARHHVAPPVRGATLAHTGADLTAPTIAASSALLITGVVLYRRFRPKGDR